jgi:benzil reductase ((S)-benzoin forming)
MNYIIITGASKGLGYSIAKGLISKDNHIFCISRKKNEQLINAAKAGNCSLNYYEYDLSDVAGLDNLIQSIFDRIKAKDNDTICLVNNAGIVTPVKPADKCTSNEIARNITVNATAPMILTSLLIKHARDFKVEKRVINISSGAGKKPYYGWSVYCGSKAAVDLFTRCISLEQQAREYPVKIISFAPGIVDTDMQKEIRSAAKEDFEQLERFVAFKNDGKLSKPEYVAGRVIELIFDKEFIDGGVIDIGQYKKNVV